MCIHMYMYMYMYVRVYVSGWDLLLKLNSPVLWTGTALCLTTTVAVMVPTSAWSQQLISDLRELSLLLSV